MKKIVSIILTMALMISQMNVSIFAEENIGRGLFNDIENHYANEVITSWGLQGLTSGFEDGSFKPDSNITRAEYIAMMDSAFDIPNTMALENQKTFNDIKNTDWYSEVINKAVGLGIVTGYQDGNFGANDNITREDACVIVSNYLNLSQEYNQEAGDIFKDKKTISSYALKHVTAMAEEYYIKGTPDGNFAPQKSITRADALLILNNVYKDITGEDGIKGTIYENGKPVEDAEVIIAKKGSHIEVATIKTDENGKYETKLEQGNYDITVLKEDTVAIKGDIKLKEKQKTILKLKLEKGQKVIATFKNSGKLLKNTNLYFKTNPYKKVKTNEMGEIIIYLVKNRTYEYFYEEGENLISAGIFKTTQENELDLGEIDINKKTEIYELPKTNNDNENGGNNNNNGNGENNDNGDNKPDENLNAPVIIINKDNLTPSDDKGVYLLETKLEALTGEIKGNTDLKSINIKTTTVKSEKAQGELIISEENLIPSGNWSLESPSLMFGKNKITVTAEAKNGKTATETIVVVDRTGLHGENIKYDTEDTDGDGLYNYQEDYIGTDKTMIDTDEDGLSDHYEIGFTMTNPLKKDTDNNEIEDGEEDPDEDKLTNIQEYQLNGLPLYSDSDSDNLTDYEEYQMGTALNSLDTDNDGLHDDEEVFYDMDPLEEDTLNDGILDGDRIFTSTIENTDLDEEDNLKVTLDIKAKGSNIRTISLRRIEEDDLFLSNNIPGYMGKAIEIDGDEFESAELIVKMHEQESLSKSILGDSVNNSNYKIYYFNQETQLLEELTEQVLLDNNIVAKIKEPGKYILLNKTEFDKVWEKEILAPPNENQEKRAIDIIFVLDSSGSMSWNDSLGLRKLASKALIEKLKEEDQGSVVDFDDEAILLAKLSNNKDMLNAAMEKVDDTGGTEGYKGLRVALNQFGMKVTRLLDETNWEDKEDLNNEITDQEELKEIEPPKIDIEIENGEVVTGSAIDIEINNKDIQEKQEHDSYLRNQEAVSETRNANRYIIMLTDGEDNSTYNYNPLIEEAVKKDIKIYTVGLGTSINERLLKSIATSTSGKYFHASASDELLDIFADLSEEVIYEDKDNDGIWDYYEKYGIRLGTGEIVHLDYDEKTGYDTDNDGLSDGEELEMILTKDGKHLKYFKLHSNPAESDTDGDGLDDYIEDDNTRSISPRIDTDGDGMNDNIEGVNHKLSYTLTDRTLAIIAGLSYSNLNKYVGKKMKNIPQSAVDFGRITKENLKLLDEFEIIHANDSTSKFEQDYGLGSITLKITGNRKRTAVVYGLRGTEFKSDGEYQDIVTDIELATMSVSYQSEYAFVDYLNLVKRKKSNEDYFLTGHSLGGRIVLDILYKTYGLYFNEGKNFPKHSATFNGLGYNHIYYITLESDKYNGYKSKLYNYYYSYDLVGGKFGNSKLYKRTGSNKELTGKDKYGTEHGVDSNGFPYLKYHGIITIQEDYDLDYRNNRSLWRG